MTEACQFHDMTTLSTLADAIKKADALHRLLQSGISLRICHGQAYLSFLGRPALSGGNAEITACNLFSCSVLINATPARKSSLFLTAIPDFKKAFLTSFSTWYSTSGIVKLSLTSLA